MAPSPREIPGKQSHQIRQTRYIDPEAIDTPLFHWGKVLPELVWLYTIFETFGLAAILFYKVTTVVGRAVVENDNFKVGISLSEYRLYNAGAGRRRGCS